jgi:transcriptional regulator with XRE-family HTH domain
MRRRRSPDKTALACGLTLRAFRNKADLSQEELADLAHYHRNFVGQVERGERSLSVRSLVRFATALQADPVSMMRGIMRRLS